MADCLSAGQRDERYGLIRYAVDTLTRNPATAVYIDGGHSRWLSAEEIAARLNQVGVDHARGFSLNTSNFYATGEEIDYGERVFRARKRCALRGRHLAQRRRTSA
jgi:endoglucanase